MTQLTHWGIDPFDIVWKNFMNSNSTFNTLQEKINYPVDIYETEKGLRFELAVVGLTESDLDIQTDGDTLRIKHDRSDQEVPLDNYYQKGIARRSFDLDVPYAAEKAPKKIEIKVNQKQILKG